MIEGVAFTNCRMSDCPQTLAELQAEYDRTADYDVTENVASAKRFVVVCRRLLGRLRESAGQGSAHVRTETAKYERQIKQAKAWLKPRARQNNGGVIYPDMQDSVSGDIDGGRCRAS